MIQSTYQTPAPTEPAYSNRNFGLTVGGVLVVLGTVRSSLSVFGDMISAFNWFTLCLWVGGGALLGLALVHPASLAGPSRLWHRFGLLLARIVNSLVLLLLYATCIVPIGLVMRAFGHNPLRLKRDGADCKETYWVAHEPSPLKHPMRHPF